jgi:hypothetical protein
LSVVCNSFRDRGGAGDWSRADARLVAAAISHDAVVVGDGAEALRRRAASVLSQRDETPWADRAASARALTVAAAVLAAW